MIRLIGSSSACSSRSRCCGRFGSGVVDRGEPRAASRSRPPSTSSTCTPRNCASPATARSASSTTQQLQRGFQVYKEVCSACHSLRLVAFRDLTQLGYNEAEVKAIAAGFQVPGIDPNTGEANTRPGLPTDYFP